MRVGGLGRGRDRVNRVNRVTGYPYTRKISTYPLARVRVQVYKYRYSPLIRPSTLISPKQQQQRPATIPSRPVQDPAPNCPRLLVHRVPAISPSASALPSFFTAFVSYCQLRLRVLLPAPSCLRECWFGSPPPPHLHDFFARRAGIAYAYESMRMISVF